VFSEVQYPKKKLVYSIFDEDNYKIKLKECIIRPNKDLEVKKRVETPWSMDLGIFKPYL
jgi:hypothetical protein